MQPQPDRAFSAAADLNFLEAFGWIFVVPVGRY
jgi:hypothetical protein